MPKCPKCGREIDALLNYKTGWQEAEVKADKDGDLEWNTNFYSDKNDNDLDRFLCPLCFEVLVTDDEEVVEFLKGE